MVVLWLLALQARGLEPTEPASPRELERMEEVSATEMAERLQGLGARLDAQVLQLARTHARLEALRAASPPASFVEADSKRAEHRFYKTAAPVGVLVLLASVLGAIISTCCGCMGSVLGREEGWYHDVPAFEWVFRPGYKFADTKLFVCIHSVQLFDPVADLTEYLVAVLSRQAGSGRTRPPKNLLQVSSSNLKSKAEPMEALTSKCHQLPESVTVLVKPKRPELQLAVMCTPQSKVMMYAGAASVNLEDYVDQSLPREQVLRVLDASGKVIGSMSVTLRRDLDDMSPKALAWVDRNGGLKSVGSGLAAAMDEAFSGRDGRSPGAATDLEALARVLTGNFLVAGQGKTGLRWASDDDTVLRPKYFLMKLKQKQRKWFWVWHKEPHEGTGPVPESNPMEGYIPLSSVQAVAGVSGDRNMLLVRYSRRGREPGELLVAAHGRGLTRETFFDCVRGREELMQALGCMKVDARDGGDVEEDEDGRSSGGSHTAAPPSAPRTATATPAISRRQSVDSERVKGTKTGTAIGSALPEAPKSNTHHIGETDTDESEVLEKPPGADDTSSDSEA